MTAEKTHLDGTASVLEVASFGYKAAIRSVKELALLSLPFSLLYGPLAAMYGVSHLHAKMTGRTDITNDVLIPLFFSAFCCVFTYVCFFLVARYTRDVFWGEQKTRLFSYSIFTAETPGAFGLAVLHCIGLVGLTLFFGVLAFCGFFLLAAVSTMFASAISSLVMGFIVLGIFALTMIPVIFIFNTYNAVFALALGVFLGEPRQGVFNAVSSAFGLLRGNWMRTTMLGVLFTVISIILLLPCSLLGGTMGMMASYIPHMMASPFFFLGYMILAILSNMVSMGVSGAGFMFTLYRYYYDLQLRHGGGELVTLMDLRRKQLEPERKLG